MLSADIIVLGFVTGFILYRLYTTLGRKDDDGSHYTTKKNDVSGIIDISSMVKTVDESSSELSPIETSLSAGFEDVVAEIKKIEKKFSLEKFLNGAQKAFEMILTAFAENDRQTLEKLLDKNTYKQFISEIDRRIKNEITLNLTLVALPKVEIKNIKLRNKTLSIEVFYHSQQINLLKNKKEEIIEGDVSQIDNVEDTWTFSKELNSNEDWKLVKV
ncbi:MAG: Tim44/TimA family putative adaptor protein [Rickettsiales bacterium]|jgi:predicted lipid-binding transport protein (Tim44 family)|nr:Tim44/TimA family putative adaptor protein [Rickettsiales bacterium]